jgi:solute carrier family 35 protein E3
VIVNKYLISTLGYRYVTFLTALHQVYHEAGLGFRV